MTVPQSFRVRQCGTTISEPIQISPYSPETLLGAAKLTRTPTACIELVLPEDGTNVVWTPRVGRCGPRLDDLTYD